MGRGGGVMKGHKTLEFFFENPLRFYNLKLCEVHCTFSQKWNQTLISLTQRIVFQQCFCNVVIHQNEEDLVFSCLK